MKKDATTEVQEKSRKPFFARLLEEQDLTEVAGGIVTKKYPSDSDEDDFLTLKYPSDSDEHSYP
jgi:hypothetical protein